MPFKNGTKLCICEICTCGRHHCPHKTHHKGPFGPCAFSEYTDKYKEHPIYQTKSCKPDANAAQSQGPLSDKTTHRLDYIPHPLGEKYVHKVDPYKRPDGDFDDTTMYKKEYTEKCAPRQRMVQKVAPRVSQAQFEGEPTYRTDYKEWQLPNRDRAKTAPGWRPSDKPFEGMPCYKTDYVPHKISPVLSYKPDNKRAANDAPFQDLTDYRQSYVPHPLEGKQKKEKEAFVRPQVPFQGMSTFTRDYTPKEGGRMKSCKPDASAFLSNAPLASDTTFRTDYTPWPLERPHAHQYEKYKRPDGEMNLDTTYDTEYVPHELRKRAGFKMPPRAKTQVPFEGTTDYRDNYHMWNMAPRKQWGPAQDWIKPQVPFEGLSTTKDHYIRHCVDPRKSYKPDQSRAPGGAPFDDKTNYRIDYVPKELTPCPAAILETDRSRFVYQEQDDCGHKYYQAKNGQKRTVRTSSAAPATRLANPTPIEAH